MDNSIYCNCVTRPMTLAAPPHPPWLTGRPLVSAHSQTQSARLFLILLAALHIHSHVLPGNSLLLKWTRTDFCILPKTAIRTGWDHQGDPNLSTKTQRWTCPDLYKSIQSILKCNTIVFSLLHAVLFLLSCISKTTLNLNRMTPNSKLSSVIKE